VTTADSTDPTPTDPTPTRPTIPGAGSSSTSGQPASSSSPPSSPTPASSASSPASPSSGAVRAAAIASLGAGAIHATAAGAHGEHRGVVVAFALTAALQMAWGALAMVRSGRLVCLAGVAVNVGALGGWLQAKTSGIGFIEGLDTKESPQFADSLAAALAAVAVAGALLGLVALAGRFAWASPPRPALVGAATVATLALAVPGMVSAGGHSHAGGDHHDAAAGGHDHHAATEEAVPYDATLPVDLSGVAGVSDEEVADAEELVTITLERLPQFADPADAEAQGYRSIRDAATGYEHFMRWDLIDDGRELDPDHPESLVYEVGPGGTRTLAAAMFMADAGTTLDDVPEVGGDLVQWHIHNDLCFTGEPGAWVVADVSPPDEPCRPGTERLDVITPMVHVWIVPHECGPFSALEGVGGGQIAEGEERLCDHAHGAGHGSGQGT
jgi:hypothetical protein